MVDKNSVYCGDCLKLMPEIEAGSIDTIIADLPYGTTACKWDSIIPLNKLWSEYSRVIKKSGNVILFSGQPFTSILVSSNLPLYRYCWYWIKEKGTGFLNSKRQPLRAVEEICVFYKEKGTYNPQMTPLEKPYKHTLPIKQSDTTNGGIKSIENPGKRQYKEYTHSFPKNTLFFPRDKGNKGDHPTQKPLALMEYLVKTYTNEGDIILDNTCGSGTTLIAAKNLNRNFIGMEISEKYCELTRNRLN